MTDDTTPQDDAAMSPASAGSLGVALDPLICDFKWQEMIRLDFEFWMKHRTANSNTETLLKRSPASGKYETFVTQVAWEAYRQGAREERRLIRHNMSAS